ncbi:hypothetical protein [Candidatus Mycoplasma haematohominis]|uniref:hypothetical protein n=1 Tax=Candidatus Mycoplasma haematohominis TaxID=1494318 RepID=UPI001C0A6A97|nr:hypothetical protein [Candidatus Mycoplasma haemohominis]
MKNLVFKYKKLHARGIFLSNKLIPIFVLFSAADTSSNELIPGLGRETSGIIAAAGMGLFLILGLIYAIKTVKEVKALRYFLKEDKANSKRLWKGLGLFFISWNILLVCACYMLIKTEVDTFKYVTYALTAVTAVLGVISNVYINTFECFNYFKIYNGKYKDTIIPEIINDIDQRKVARKRMRGR